MSTRFNPTDIQIKTWSVQRTLDPLVAEVCYIFNIKIIKYIQLFVKKEIN